MDQSNIEELYLVLCSFKNKQCYYKSFFLKNSLVSLYAYAQSKSYI